MATYNTLLKKAQTNIRRYPGISKYQLAKKMGSDPRTMDNIIPILKELNTKTEERFKIGTKQQSKYYLKDKKDK